MSHTRGEALRTSRTAPMRQVVLARSWDLQPGRKLQFGKQVLLYPEERDAGSGKFSCFNDGDGLL